MDIKSKRNAQGFWASGNLQTRRWLMDQRRGLIIKHIRVYSNYTFIHIFIINPTLMSDAITS